MSKIFDALSKAKQGGKIGIAQYNESVAKSTATFKDFQKYFGSDSCECIRIISVYVKFGVDRITEIFGREITDQMLATYDSMVTLGTTVQDKKRRMINSAEREEFEQVFDMMWASVAPITVAPTDGETPPTIQEAPE